MLSHRDKEKIHAALELTKGATPLKESFNQEDLKIIHALALTLYRKGDLEEAKPIFQRLVSLKPFEADYWQGLAFCAQAEEGYEEAIKAWTAAALLRDESPLPHFHLVECYLALGKEEDGSKAYAACQKRLSEKDFALKEKLETLSAPFTVEAQKEA